MYIHFMRKGDHVLQEDWDGEVVLSVLGPTHIDATAKAREGAKLTVVTILCSATVVVAPGTQIELSGGDVLGSHSIDVEPAAAGRSVAIEAIPVLGRIKIRSCS